MYATLDISNTLKKTRNIFCRMKADEIMFSPTLKLSAFMRAAEQNPARAARLFDRLTMDGNLGAMLDMDDMLRKSAEQMADESYDQLPVVSIAA